MEKQYELSTGILECYPLYAVFHFNSDFYDLEEAEEKASSKSVVGIAIVSNNEDVKFEAMEEQGLFKGAFSYFKSIDEAADWAETVIGAY